jgi:hypothetical protein
MPIVRQNCKRPLSFLLAIIFLAAQTGALAHAYEQTAHFEFQQDNASVSVERALVPHTIHLPLARQRAPPTPL